MNLRVWVLVGRFTWVSVLRPPVILCLSIWVSADGKAAAFPTPLCACSSALCISPSLRHSKLRGFMPFFPRKGALPGEMASPLRTLAALSEDPSSVPRLYKVAHNHPLLHFQGIWHSLLASVGTRHTWGTMAFLKTNTHSWKTVEK